MREPEMLQPHSLQSLAAALHRTTAQSRVIAGGTDLMLHLRQAAELPDVLLDLSGVAALRGITRQGTRLHIGAMTRFDDLARDAGLPPGAACLAQAAASVGSMQIRCMATLGGNVANASPCADAVPALLALQADVGVLKKDGCIERRLLADVLQAARLKQLPHDEVLFDFSFEVPGTTTFSAFAKLGARSAVTIAKLNAALVIECAGPGQPVSMARVALGSLAPVAMLDSAVAQALVGRVLDAGAAALFAQACSELVDRAIAQRPSRPYKRLAIKGLAYDLVEALTAVMQLTCAKPPI